MEIDPDDPQEVVRVVSVLINTMGDGDVISKFVEAMSREHRTLQQGFTRLVVAWILDLAHREHYDLRNEASVMLARKIVELVGKGNLCLPLV
jgi:hypothetical protein